MRQKLISMLCIGILLSVLVPLKSEATTIDTGVRSCSGAGYELYVRELGSTTMLGIMKIKRSSTEISNSFKASRSFTTPVYVYLSKYSSYGWVYDSAALSTGYTLEVSMAASNPSYAYGRAVVTY